ncbi:hypothetical protein PS918_00046 [Pseudomonas fluorescens]|uniref:Uncharacterized protein n=1 Tax=Pseudomonas fluorescens TaxID=294 RepID=A0A5E7QTL7_PSEFL|nr:hypothetical protein PS918_00046 [Pseudomonas fluorescens]
MLAINGQTPRSFRQPALSLTSIASMLAPTGDCVCQLTHVLTDTAFSRASPLPQGNEHAHPNLSAPPDGIHTPISEKSYINHRGSSVALRAHYSDSPAEAPLSNKSLRILIADEQHFNRLRIERGFNQLGYYGVAPVQNLEELLVLVEYASEPFDLLLVNAALAGDQLDLVAFCVDNRQLDRVLIYDCQRARLPSIPTGEQPKVQVSRVALPDLAAIQRLMAQVDPQQPFVGTVISVR